MIFGLSLPKSNVKKYECTVKIETQNTELAIQRLERYGTSTQNHPTNSSSLGNEAVISRRFFNGKLEYECIMTEEGL